MSWLSGLAGKAEALLEAVDQTAADSFSRDGQTDVIPRHAASLHNTPENQRIDQPATPLSTPPSSYSNVGSRSSQVNALSTAKARSSSMHTRPSDQKLFDFLNNSGGEEESLTRNSSSPSLGTKEKRKDESLTPSRVASKDSLTSLKSVDSVDGNQEGLTMTVGGQSRSNTPQMSSLAKDSSSVSSLQVENQMLREEVTALQRELHDWAGRERKSHGELTSLKKQCTKLQSDFTTAQKALTARENELVSLRKQVADVESESKKQRSAVTSLQDERQRMLEESVASAGVQNQTLELVENRLKEAEVQLRKERDALGATQAEVDRLRQRDEQQHSELAQSVLTLQGQLEQEKAVSAKRLQAVSVAQGDAQRCRQEMDEYKQRAARILQAKEQLIAKLKEGGSDDSNAACHSAELEALQEEKSLLQEVFRQTKQELDHLRAENEDVESAHLQELNAIQEQRDQAENLLMEEQRQRSVADMEFQQRQKDMEKVQDELVRQKAALHAQMKDSQDQITALQEKVLAVQHSSQNGGRNNEMESRMHTLTDNLLSKQNLVETLSSEKNALLLQLEKAKQAASQAEAVGKRSVHNHSVHVGNWEETDGDTQGRLRPMSSMMPGSLVMQSDEGLVKHMRSAANSLDTFSVRLGRFLRRYPMARLMVIVYMILLHIWVTIVLLTYQPEMHASGSFKAPHDPNPP